MTKELTLLICNHNHGKYLYRMLKDVFDQTLAPSRWKILLILDECTDGSMDYFESAWEALCNEYILSEDWLELNVLVREKKEGLAACKNFGLKHIDTPYVAYLDADDGMFPERLERQLDMLTVGNVSLDVCACQAWDRDKHGGLFINCFEIGQYQYHDQIEKQIVHENVICHGSVMARKRAIMEVNGYREDQYVLGMEDWNLWQRMINCGSIFYTIPERLYIWSRGTSTER